MSEEIEFSVLYSYNKFIIVISDYLLEVDIQRITTLNCTNVVTSFFIFESKVIFSNYSSLVSEAERFFFFGY
ncbi:predicted protein [Enterococcus faecalis ARO1/DG]|nr:predicted protein [Enterococcus faecalis ARO1/DG]